MSEKIEYEDFLESGVYVSNLEKKIEKQAKVIQWYEKENKHNQEIIIKDIKEIERLNKELDIAIDICNKRQVEIVRLNNIIGTIKGMFNDCDNHFEDGCDCKRIEEFLRIVGSDKE